MPRKTTLAGVRPHTRKVADEILNRWVIYYVWGDGPDGHHAAGRAIDFMVLTEDQRAIRTRVGNEIAAYVRRHHRRLGVQYVIWRRRIWNATRSDDRNRVAWSSWRRMEDRGNPTANHMDHPHVSLLNNPPAYRPPEDDMPDLEEYGNQVVHKTKIKVNKGEGKDWEESLAWYVQHLEQEQDVTQRLVRAQGAAIDKLVDAIQAGPGQDVETLKREIREAIESVTATVTLDVTEGT